MAKLLITGATLIDGTGAPPRARAAVLVDGDRIAAVGGAGDIDRGGAELIDLAGKWLLPGLVSAHEHFSMKGFRGKYYDQHRKDDRLQSLRMAQAAWQTLREGVTTARDCGAHGMINLLLRQAVAEGIASGPRIVTSGQNIVPRYDAPGVEPTGMTREAGDGDEVERIARDLVAEGVDFIKVKAFRSSFTGHGSRNFTAAEMKRAFDVAHAAGRRGACHAYTGQEVRDALEAGADNIEHALFAQSDLEAIDEMAKHGTYFTPCPTSWGNSRHGTPERRADHRVTVKRAIEKGVKVAPGCDLYAESVVDDLTLFAELGLPIARAIEAGTRIAAEAADRAGDVGTVAAGKLADLIAIDADPLRDLGALRRPAWIMKDGVVELGVDRSVAAAR